MSIAAKIHAEQAAFARSQRRSAGHQALIARNEEIRRLLRKGVTSEEIARRYGIGVSTVGKIHVGRS